MKKFIALSLLLLSAAAFVPSAEAKSEAANTLSANNAAAQYQVYQNRRNNRRARTVIQTRTVRRGRALFRETYRVTYRPNGAVRTQLVSRVRIR